MAGLEWIKMPTNEMDRKDVRSLRKRFGNDGLSFYFNLKLRCHNADLGLIEIEDEFDLQELARAVGVNTDLLIEMIEFACNDAKDWGVDGDGVLTEVTMLDRDIWKYNQTIYSHEWVNNIIGTIQKNKYLKEKNAERMRLARSLAASKNMEAITDGKD